MKRAQKHLELCEDIKCRYNANGGVCCFGIRRRYCYQEGRPSMDQVVDDFNKDIIREFEKNKSKIIKIRKYQFEIKTLVIDKIEAETIEDARQQIMKHLENGDYDISFREEASISDGEEIKEDDSDGQV